MLKENGYTYVQILVQGNSFETNIGFVFAAYLCIETNERLCL